jgi:hypothetical protein
VFLLNSRLRLFTATAFLLNAATLLPKLRVHFAEFLNEGSHKHLRILIPPTCVGLRYGYKWLELNEVFLGNWGQQLIPEQAPYFRPCIYPNVVRIYLNDRLFTSTASISRLAYPIASPHNTII